MEVITNYPEIATDQELSPLAKRRLATTAMTLDGFEKVVPAEAKNRSLLEVEKGLKKKIIGQSEAIESLVAALEMADLKNPNRPIASFLFLGPTGVGKSETAKELSRLLHHGEDGAFLKIDCTQFTEQGDVSALLGAPPRYVGREQKPLLDPQIIGQEKSVILIDEIEKGHPKMHDLFMQILEEGEVTLLNGGNKVSFRDSIIIITSNVGSKEITKLNSGNHIGFASAAGNDKKKASKKSIDGAAHKALMDKFRPEFINRIDYRITYGSLSDEQLSEVLDNYVFTMSKTPQLRQRNIRLTLDPDVIDEIVNQSPHRDELGARPVLRRFEQTVWRDFGKNIRDGVIPNDSWVVAKLKEDAEDCEAAVPVDFFRKQTFSKRRSGGKKSRNDSDHERSAEPRLERLPATIQP